MQKAQKVHKSESLLRVTPRRVMFDHRGAFARVSCVAALCLACLTSSVASVRDAGAPGGVVFTLAVAFAFSIESSRLARLLPPTPTLTTQMCAGVLLRNIPGVRTAVGAIDGDAATTVRALALGLILSRAGLASDADAWRRRARATTVMALAPATCETLVVSGMGAWLFSLNASTAFALGFLMSAISLAVVVPPALELKREGLGEDAGVADLILGASILDGIYCIVGFGICAEIAGSGGSGGTTAWKAPTQIVVGALGGAATAELALRSGTLSAPGRPPNAGVMDASIILSLVMVILFAAKELDANGGGALMCVTFCVRVASAWRRLGLDDALANACAFMNTLWNDFTAPLLFVVIGCSLDLWAMTADVAGKALAIIFVGGAARALGAFFASSASEGAGLRERAFMALAWMPKATIQAALASVVYDDAVREHGANSPQALNGEKLLQTALLCVLITAPLGAWCVAYYAPKMLTKKTPTDDGSV